MYSSVALKEAAKSSGMISIPKLAGLV